MDGSDDHTEDEPAGFGTAATEVGALVAAVEELAHPFGIVDADHGLTQYVLDTLATELPAIAAPHYPAQLAAFVAVEEAKLSRIFARYRETVVPVTLLWQPELLVIFERLTVTPHALTAAWRDRLPADELDFARDVWGM